MALKQLSLTRGDSQTYTLTFKDANGSPYCLKNWAVKFTLKTNPDLPDAQASLQKIVTSFSDSTGGTSGVAKIALLPADTENLDPQKYDFDVQVTTAANENYTVMKGVFTLEYDVTRSAGTAGTG
jgi:hypothetical protein